MSFISGWVSELDRGDRREHLDGDKNAGEGLRG